MRTDYHICPNCGAALDPGERCDCLNENKEAASGATNTESGQKVNKIEPSFTSIKTENGGFGK